MNRSRFLLSTIAVLLIAGVAVLYIGTTHRDNCIKARNVACSIVPWSGHAKTPASVQRGWSIGGQWTIPR